MGAIAEARTSKLRICSEDLVMASKVASRAVLLMNQSVARIPRSVPRKPCSLGVSATEDEKVTIAFWKWLRVGGRVEVCYGIHTLGIRRVTLNSPREIPVHSVCFGQFGMRVHEAGTYTRIVKTPLWIRISRNCRVQ